MHYRRGFSDRIADFASHTWIFAIYPFKFLDPQPRKVGFGNIKFADIFEPTNNLSFSPFEFDLDGTLPLSVRWVSHGLPPWIVPPTAFADLIGGRASPARSSLALSGGQFSALFPGLSPHRSPTPTIHGSGLPLISILFYQCLTISISVIDKGGDSPSFYVD